ncbi:glycosyltransferase family 2 protein [Ferrimonas balearica]|uniref:glycosyltransferase family 2 protein n=1 Tax=Ferrimonas balearica TaxID=44012 RepID=UPI001C99E5F5|nr:glycosyltransferase family 2 protein [Ferrimonas balearica]MBY5923587.1 glycosyltransferase [Ferrimonas balearica]MBY5997350.1 glycosyltransferase [Ferrimonas balearica]
MNRSDLITVVITTYNRPDRLAKAIASVAAQDYPNLELVVVDDCSSKDYSSVLKGASIPLRYFRQERNQGACAARNLGIREAKGKWIAFLDDDDQWAPEKLSRQVAAIGEADLCLCGYRVIENGHVQVLPLKQISAKRLFRYNRICGTSGVLGRTEALRQEGFDESLVCSQDWDLFLRYALRQPLRYVAAPLCLFSDGSHERISNSAKALSIPQIERRLLAVEKHRSVIGEDCYRSKVAATALAYIGSRSNKLEALQFAVNRAGWKASLAYLFNKVGRRSSASRPTKLAEE